MEYLDYLVLIFFLNHLQKQDNHMVDEKLILVEYFSMEHIDHQSSLGDISMKHTRLEFNRLELFISFID